MTKRNLLLGACALLIVSSGLALGGKWKPPSPVDSGVIYVKQGLKLLRMDTDGTDRTETGFLKALSPSRVPHDGARWYLELREIEDGATYPSGYAQHELFAVTEDGDAVQLTDDATIEPNYLYGWLYGDGRRTQMKWATRGDVTDGKVSYLAIRWDGSDVAEYGVYVLDVDPDNLSDHEAVSYGDGGGTFLPVETGLRHNSDVAMIWAWYDWSPDGKSIAYRYNVPEISGLLVAGETSEWEPLLVAEGLDLVYTEVSWSPDGSRIAFSAARQVSTYLETVADLHTVEPDGSNETAVLKEGELVEYGMPAWSPSGDYLICTRTLHPRKKPKGSWTPESVEVYRAEADGSNAVSLTGDTSTFIRTVAWVADE